MGDSGVGSERRDAGSTAHVELIDSRMSEGQTLLKTRDLDQRSRHVPPPSPGPGAAHLHSSQGWLVIDAQKWGHSSFKFCRRTLVLMAAMVMVCLRQPFSS